VHHEYPMNAFDWLEGSRVQISTSTVTMANWGSQHWTSGMV